MRFGLARWQWWSLKSDDALVALPLDSTEVHSPKRLGGYLCLYRLASELSGSKWSITGTTWFCAFWAFGLGFVESSLASGWDWQHSHCEIHHCVQSVRTPLSCISKVSPFSRIGHPIIVWCKFVQEPILSYILPATQQLILVYSLSLEYLSSVVSTVAKCSFISVWLTLRISRISQVLMIIFMLIHTFICSNMIYTCILQIYYLHRSASPIIDVFFRSLYCLVHIDFLTIYFLIQIWWHTLVGYLKVLLAPQWLLITSLLVWPRSLR